MAALVPVLGNRPPIVQRFGGYVYVSIHDAEHLRVRKLLKLRMARFHPDRAGRRWKQRTSQFKTFKEVVKVYQHWLRDEARWYAEFQVAPPLPITSAELGPSGQERKAAIERVCPECLQTFTQTQTRRDRCSRTCANRARMRQVRDAGRFTRRSA